MLLLIVQPNFQSHCHNLHATMKLQSLHLTLKSVWIWSNKNHFESVIKAICLDLKTLFLDPLSSGPSGSSLWRRPTACQLSRTWQTLTSTPKESWSSTASSSLQTPKLWNPSSASTSCSFKVQLFQNIKKYLVLHSFLFWFHHNELKQYGLNSFCIYSNVYLNIASMQQMMVQILK